MSRRNAMSERMEIEYELTADQHGQGIKEWYRQVHPAASTIWTVIMLGGIVAVIEWDQAARLVHLAITPMVEIVRLLVGCLTASVAVFFFFTWWNDLQAPNRRGVAGRHKVLVGPHFVEHQWSASVQRVRWTVVSGVWKLSNFVAIKIGDNYVYVPRNAFSSIRAADAFFDEMRQHRSSAISITPNAPAVSQAWPPPPREPLDDQDEDEFASGVGSLDGPGTSKRTFELSYDEYRLQYWQKRWIFTLIRACGLSVGLGLVNPLQSRGVPEPWDFVIACLPLLLIAFVDNRQCNLDFGKLTPMARSYRFETDFKRCLVANGEIMLNSDIRDISRVSRQRNGNIHLTQLTGKVDTIPVAAFGDRDFSKAFYDRFREAWQAARERVAEHA